MTICLNRSFPIKEILATCYSNFEPDHHLSRLNQMNPSRTSYSYPDESNIGYPKCVILKSCEFCNRTFIPDSLTKHRKVCYKAYLKKRSNLSSKKSSLSRRRSKSLRMSAGDIPEMTVSELMVKRQIRRMQWRGRHEDFIRAIREAREYALAVNNGIQVPVPVGGLSVEQMEEMQQCKYCLRKFHKSSFEKHLERCKEYSIRSVRAKPDEAQIEAKRRLSLRLYYKPKSYRGDSPDDFTNSFSSNDLDCQSLLTYNSQKISTRKSRDSHSHGTNSKVKRQSSVSIPKSQTSGTDNKVKRHRSTAFRKCRDSMESGSQSIACYRNKSKNRITDSKSNADIASQKPVSSEKFNQVKNLIPNLNFNDKSKTDDCKSMDTTRPSGKSHQNSMKQEGISNKLKTISSILNQSSNQNNDFRHLSEAELNLLRAKLPNPSESLKKAKEILQFLDVRIQQNNYIKDNHPPYIEKQDYEENESQYMNFSSIYDDKNYESPPDSNLVSTKEFLQNTKLNLFFNDIEQVKDSKCMTDKVMESTKHERLLKNVNVCELATEKPDCCTTTKKEVVDAHTLDMDKTPFKNPFSMTTSHIDPEYAQIWRKA